MWCCTPGLVLKPPLRGREAAWKLLKSVARLALGFVQKATQKAAYQTFSLLPKPSLCF